MNREAPDPSVVDAETPAKTLRELSCADDYDPDSMPVERARALIHSFLAAGGRKIDAWYASLATVEVAFDDEADAFRNINTAAELAASAAPRSA